MESLKLNNAPASLFVGSRTDERKEIVAGSRLLLAESHGKLFANARKEKFEARMNEAEYRKMNESISQKTFLFCAKVAAQATGQDAPKDYAEFLRGKDEYCPSGQWSDKRFAQWLASTNYSAEVKSKIRAIYNMDKP